MELVSCIITPCFFAGEEFWERTVGFEAVNNVKTNFVLFSAVPFSFNCQIILIKLMTFSFGEVCLHNEMYVTLLVNYMCHLFS